MRSQSRREAIRGRGLLLVAALAVATSVAACQSGAATPVPPPPATPTVTVTDTPRPVATATPKATPKPTATPAPTAPPTATPAPIATPTPAASGSADAGSSASPSATPLPSASCTGGASTKQWLVDQVPHFKFKLYCAVMPSGWSLVAMSSAYDVPGVQAHYKNKAGAMVDIWQGNVCGLSPNPCSGNWPESLGTAAFGPLNGTLTGDSTSQAWSNVVTTSDPTIRYVITGTGFDIATYKSISAAMHPLS